MANRFQSTNSNDLQTQFNTFASNPTQFLANAGVDNPQGCLQNPEAYAKQMLGNFNANQQNYILQSANMLARMFGYIR